MYKVEFSRIQSIIIFGIIILSFFLFSTAFYPFISSDDALNVLMAHSYELPHDLYCWGQDRGGTLIPLISQIFIKPFGISALWAVSISYYLVLGFGFLGFSTLFKNKKLLLLLALFWFFPYQRFSQLLVFPIGMGYSMLGFSIFFIRKINWKKRLLFHFPNLLRIGMIAIIWLLAVWCSDLVFISLITFGLTALFFAVIHRKDYKQHLLPATISYFGILTLLFFTIKKAKTYVTGKTEEFMDFNGFADIKTALNIVKTKSIEVLFGKEDTLLAIGGWLIAFFIVAGMYQIIRTSKSIIRFENFWINFFLLDFMAILGVIFLSNWVLLNEMGRWYFVAPYISFGISFLLLLDKSEVLNKRKKYYAAIALFLVLGFTNISNALFISKGKYKPKTSLINELNSLGKIGVIAHYWEAYLMAIVNPNDIKTTPMESGGVRNDKFITEVFTSPKIYISQTILSNPHFPDSVVQFGVTLFKKGQTLKIAGTTLCAYAVKKIPQAFTLKELNHLPEAIQPETGEVQISADQNRFKDQIIVFGPFQSVLPGKYKLRIYSKTLKSSLPDHAILMDICSFFGAKSTGFEDIKLLPQMKEGTEHYFEKTFQTAQLLQHTEFRILVKKPANFNFSRYELIPIFE